MHFQSLLVCAPLLATGLAACGSTNGQSTASQPAAATAATSAQAAPRPAVPAGKSGAAVVKVSSSRYGKILVDGTGRTLYLFTRDVKPSSRCYGSCAKAWPPFTTAGTPTAGKGATAGLLRSAARSSGPRQVTYGGHPLYHYRGESQAGQILCQNVAEFGGTWLVVKPSGAAVR
jgi:predicted lipoprotein with Yx(FWY)xxD motif